MNFGRIKIKKVNSCFEVTSHKQDKFGYPRISYRKINTPAHRYIYILNKGEIPQGKLVRHSCDNPKCVNLAHLSLGTIQDNVADRHKRGRTSRVPRTNGEINGMSKLSSKEIEKIRALRNKKPQTVIAKMFGISQSHVSGIQRNAYWSHLGGING